MIAAPTRAQPILRPDWELRDSDLRAAMLNQVIADHVADPHSLVVEEMGLRHGANRVDIAVVNGHLHGYELKSEVDTLDRLTGQVTSYSQVFDRVTLVSASKHLRRALPMLPEWWGVKVATRASCGGVIIDTVRPAEGNPSVSSFHVAELLWRDEAIAILEELGTPKKALRVNKAGLFRLLSEALPLPDLSERVRNAIRARENWRANCPRPA